MHDPSPEKELLTKPTARKAVGLTIVLLLEVLAFIAAVIGIGLSEVASDRTTHQTMVAQQTIGEERATLERIGTLVVRLDARGQRAEPATLGELHATAGHFGDTLAALSHDGAMATPERAKLLTQLGGSWTTLASALALSGSPRGLAEQISAASSAYSTARAPMDDAFKTLEAGLAPTDGDPAKMRVWLFPLALLLVVAMVVTLFQRVSRSRKELEVYARDLEHRTGEAMQSTKALAEAKAGSDLIMETVDRGLFLLDREYKIQPQYSRELERMFRLPELEGYNFVNLLQRLLTERTFEISRDYMGLLFDRKKKERTVLRVNPLAEIEVHFANPTGGFDSKFLNFTFRRIVDNDQVARVFVAVSDITDRVRLERQLRESEARKERQFEFLLGVLHVDPASLDDFLRTANEQVAVMNEALRASDFATNTAGRMELLRQRLDVVYRAVHTVKGNASSLELAYFEKTCDIFEGKIVQLRERSALGGDDFLSVVIAQSELRQDLDELQDLRERFVGLGRMTTAKTTSIAPKSEPAIDVVGSIAQFAAQLGTKLGKDVRVEAPGFSTAELPDALRRTVRDVLVQLTRNSLVHGIESPGIRSSLGKVPMGTITIARTGDTAANSFGFTFRDDGAGLDPALIREKAVAKRIITPEQAAKISDEQLVGLIFRPAFSTLDDATSDAGRGIGMNVIKEAIVDKCGGNLSMSSEPGKYTEFSFLVPIVEAAPAVRPTNGVATLAFN